MVSTHHRVHVGYLRLTKSTMFFRRKGRANEKHAYKAAIELGLAPDNWGVMNQSANVVECRFVMFHITSISNPISSIY